jgi:hypothetical protein
MKVVEHTPRMDVADLRRHAAWPQVAARRCSPAPVRGTSTSVTVVWDRTAYGWRPWLECPRCGSRRRHLYQEGRTLACRRCAGLKYLVQTWPDSRWRMQVGRPALAAWRKAVGPPATRS